MAETELTLTGELVDLEKYIENAGGIHGLRGINKVRGWNNIEYGAGLSGKNTPATKLSMNKAFIPPGGVAKAHIHVDFDVMYFYSRDLYDMNLAPGVGIQWFIVLVTCFTLSPACLMKYSIVQPKNGWRR